jgi:hypothetical protein
MKDISKSPWLNKDLVELKIAENAAKAKADREQVVLRAKIVVNYSRVQVARVAK